MPYPRDSDLKAAPPHYIKREGQSNLTLSGHHIEQLLLFPTYMHVAPPC